MPFYIFVYFWLNVKNRLMLLYCEDVLISAVEHSHVVFVKQTTALNVYSLQIIDILPVMLCVQWTNDTCQWPIAGNTASPCTHISIASSSLFFYYYVPKSLICHFNVYQKAIVNLRLLMRACVCMCVMSVCFRFIFTH